MSQCGGCGERIQRGDRFCSQCGKPKVNLGVKAVRRTAAFFKKHKGWTIGAACVLALIAGLYGYGKQMTGESSSIGQLEAAFAKEDAARVAFMLKTENNAVIIDEAKARTIIEYVKENKLLGGVIKDLRGQAGGGTAHSFIELKKDGRQFGIYSRYRFIVHTSTVEVHTNYEGAEIKVNGKTAAASDSGDFTASVGPLVPGTYRLQAEYAGEYTTLKTEKTVTVDGGVREGVIDLSMRGADVSVDSNYTGAAIFIDDRDTGAVTGFAQHLGPVSLDGTNRIHVEKTFPWGTARSKPVPIDKTSIHLEIDPNTDELKNAVIKTTSEFLQSWMDAYRRLDPAAIKHLSKDRRASLASNIEEYKANGLIYEGQMKKLVFDLDSIYIQQEADGTYRTMASVQHTYSQRYYASGQTPPDPSEYTDTLSFRLNYQNGQWLVADWSEDYNFSDKNTKTVSY